MLPGTNTVNNYKKQEQVVMPAELETWEEAFTPMKLWWNYVLYEQDLITCQKHLLSTTTSFLLFA